jgi:hypothetical protein
VLNAFRVLGAGFYSALIPSPERDRLALREGVEPARWSVFLGLLEGAVGLTLYCSGALAYMQPLMQEQGMVMLEHWDELKQALGRTPTANDFNQAGLLTFIAWHFRPEAWLYTIVAVTGLVRCAAFLVSREAVAEPAVWIGMRVTQLLTGRFRAKKRESELGPPRPDKFLLEEGSDLVVLTMRPKPEWNPRVTIEVRGKHYRLAGVEDRRDGAWDAIAYVLREADDAEVVRGFVRYEEWDPSAEPS